MNTGNIVVDVGKCTGCLNCELICSFTFTQTFNPSKARIVHDDEGIWFTEECTECGLCTDYCVYGAIRRREEED